MEKPRVMALDVGEARIGVALSDPLGLSAQPHTTVEAKTLNAAFAQLEDIIKKYRVGKIVIGLPWKLDGSVAEQGQRVLKFHNRLQKHLGTIPEFSEVTFDLWDERLTTAQASRVLVDSKLKNKEKSAALDRISAAIILESFLQSKAF